MSLADSPTSGPSSLLSLGRFCLQSLPPTAEASECSCYLAMWSCDSTWSQLWGQHYTGAISFLLIESQNSFHTKDIKQTQTIQGSSMVMTGGDELHCSSSKVVFCSLSASSETSDSRVEMFLQAEWKVWSGLICVGDDRLGMGKIEDLPSPLPANNLHQAFGPQIGFNILCS